MITTHRELLEALPTWVEEPCPDYAAYCKLNRWFFANRDRLNSALTTIVMANMDATYVRLYG